MARVELRIEPEPPEAVRDALEEAILRQQAADGAGDSPWWRAGLAEGVEDADADPF